MAYHWHEILLTDALLDVRATKAINRRASEERAATTVRAARVQLQPVASPGSPHPQIR